MSSATKARFESLQSRTDADSMAEVVRMALAVYDHLIELHEEGNRLDVIDPDGKRVGPLTLLPGFPRD